MKNKCDYYHTQTEKQHTYHITGEPIYYDAEVSVCWGTKERDRCSCGGNRIKCDFYPEVREKAKKVITNADKIRSVNDKELAKFLSDFHDNKIAMDEICHAGLCLDDEDCVGCTLKWLQKPVKEE